MSELEEWNRRGIGKDQKRKKKKRKMSELKEQNRRGIRKDQKSKIEKENELEE